MKKLNTFTITTLVLMCVSIPAEAETIIFDRFDKNHSTVAFNVPIMAGLSQVEGKFTDFDATVNYDLSDITKSSVTAVIRVESINTGISDRDEHLRTADFFDVETFPEIHFSSDSVIVRGADTIAICKLVMKDISKPVELVLHIRPLFRDEENRVLLGLSTSVSLDRQDYGVAWRHPDPLFVGDNVEVKIHLISKLKRLSPPVNTE